jgi:hypothetical protein
VGQWLLLKASVRAGRRLRVLVRTWAFIAVEGGGVGVGPRRC